MNLRKKIFWLDLEQFFEKNQIAWSNIQISYRVHCQKLTPHSYKIDKKECSKYFLHQTYKFYTLLIKPFVYLSDRLITIITLPKNRRSSSMCLTGIEILLYKTASRRCSLFMEGLIRYGSWGHFNLRLGLFVVLFWITIGRGMRASIAGAVRCRKLAYKASNSFLDRRHV